MGHTQAAAAARGGEDKLSGFFRVLKEIALATPLAMMINGLRKPH